MKPSQKKIETIDDLQPDSENANRGTARGHYVIEHSIATYGAGRSGLAARDGTMIAGNQTLQKMQELGMKVKPVHTKGDEWVVVIRDDIAPGSEQAKLLGLADNRASAVGLDIDPHVLADLAATYTEGVAALYFPEELAKELSRAATETTGIADIPIKEPKPERTPKDCICPNCQHRFKL